MGDGSPDPPPTTTLSGPEVRSAVLIPVAEAESVVGRWRQTHDPVAAGVPAHVTLIAPWIPPASIDPAALNQLAEVVGGRPAWDFDLTNVAWFGSRVLWLAPDPAEPFRELTRALADRFGTPPWGGEFDEVVPHLTVAHAAGDDASLHGVEAVLKGCLPVRCRAEQVWVMVGDGRAWTVRGRFPLR